MPIDDFRSEYARYRGLAEKALAQMPDAELNRVPSPEGNSAAMVVRHVSGNLVSRFTNFLTEDGEKPDRDRESEFEERPYDRAELERLWRRGFTVVEDALAPLTDADLARTVTIRGRPLTVHAALTRSVAHVAYHVGQIVLLARITAGSPWESLSIPRGQSATYDASPTREQRPG
ncbi:MAG TPA: DUF1572 family protein [Gemmatimonadaceae bacterium]|nr:DUF1572 family protein [Gemmatimonadaceae bacterium]